MHVVSATPSSIGYIGIPPDDLLLKHDIMNPFLLYIVSHYKASV